MIYLIIGAVLLFLIAAFFAITYWCYRYVFYSKTKKGPNVGNSLSTEQYDRIWDALQRKMEEFKAMEHEHVQIKSYDGLTLRGRFFKAEGSERAVIIFHGFRSHVNSDGCLIAKFCLEHGFNVLAVHQRAHGKSDGSTITFGIKERLDCKAWVDYTVNRLGKDTKIMLSGVSMGAATVMMASDLEIPAVKGIFADCGYSSPREILRTVIKKLGYPVDLAYGALRIGAKIYGGFDPEETSAENALSNSNIPLTIIHSDADRYVPCYMANKCYDAAKAENKRLVIITEAGHALSYYFDTETYEAALNDMLDTVSES